MGLLPDTQNYGLRMPREYRERLVSLLPEIFNPLNRARDDMMRSSLEIINPWICGFGRNIVAHIQAKYRTIRIKTFGTYSIWKKVDGQTDDDDYDGQTTDGSA